MIRKQSNDPSLFDLGGSVVSCTYCDVFINFADECDDSRQVLPVSIMILSQGDCDDTIDAVELRLTFDQALQIANRLLRLIGEPKKH